MFFAVANLYKTIVHNVKPGERCVIHDNPEENIDGSEIEKYVIPTMKGFYNDMNSYVLKKVE